MTKYILTQVVEDFHGVYLVVNYYVDPKDGIVLDSVYTKSGDNILPLLEGTRTFYGLPASDQLLDVLYLNQ